MKNKIKYAINSLGELIYSNDASKNELYYCIECGDKLILKDGDIRIKHFSHISEVKCNGESLIHKTAKRLVKKQIIENAKGLGYLYLESICSNCDKKELIRIKPKTFNDSKEEVSISNFICDVVAYRNDEACLGIEIFYTHKVSEKKKENLNIPWIELDASQVIENPTKWIPIQFKLKPRVCKNCKNHGKKIEEIANRYGINRDLYSTIKDISNSSYIAEIDKCFKCHFEIPIFWWRGVPFSNENPPEPRPHTIMLKYSKTIGKKYFANTCANCGMIQGDNFVFLKNSKFKQLPLNEEYKEYRDQISIDEVMRRMTGSRM